MFRKDWFINKFYRNKVIGLVLNSQNEFLIVQNVIYSNNQWNFAGGGVNKNETEENALLRELQEELGTNKFKIFKKSNNKTKYNWPFKLILKRLIKNQKLLLGQSQRYFLVKYLGNKFDIKPDPLEIKNFKWVKEKELKNYLTFKNQFTEAINEIENFK